LSMEYDVEKHIEKEKDISYYDGLEDGKAEGEMNRSLSIAKEMLSNNLSFDIIVKCTGLSKDEILKLK
jgi:hypothetical protein